MSTELHHSSELPQLQPAGKPDHAENKAEPTNHEAALWTWPAVVLTCVLVPTALVFAAFLACHGTDPRIAGVIALVLVGGIVVCVIPSRGRASLLQRIVAAAVAFSKGGN